MAKKAPAVKRKEHVYRFEYTEYKGGCTIIAKSEDKARTSAAKFTQYAYSMKLVSIDEK